MAINKNFIAIFDFETGGINPEECEAIQVACLIVDPRTFKIVDTFESMIKSLQPDKLEAKALEVNKKTKEMIDKAPHPEVVFSNLAAFLKKYKVGRSNWDYPIPAGHNIVGFDCPIMARYCKQYKIEFPFHPTQRIDTLHMLFMWFENRPEPAKYNMDALREFFGMSKDNAHDALQDCRDVHVIMSKFLNMMRGVKAKFKGAMSPKKEEKNNVL